MSCKTLLNKTKQTGIDPADENTCVRRSCAHRPPFGMIHRNTYVNSPRTLEPTFETRTRPGLFFAGQMSGVEGYVESAASGLIAGIGAAARARGAVPAALPDVTALGALGRYIARSDPRHYQPTNIAFGLLPELERRVRDRSQKRLALSERALSALESFRDGAGEPIARARALIRIFAFRANAAPSASPGADRHCPCQRPRPPSAQPAAAPPLRKHRRADRAAR